MIAQGLAEKLVHAGHIPEELARDLNETAIREGIPLISLLLRRASTDSLKLAQLVAENFGYPVLDLSAVDLNNLPADAVDKKLIAQYRIIPLKLCPQSNTITIAIADPASLQSVEPIKFKTGLHVNIVVVDGRELGSIIDPFLASQARTLTSASQMQATRPQAIRTNDRNLPNTSIFPDDRADDTEEAPVAKAVNDILLGAVRDGSSDIHLEPGDQCFRIRYRTDGLLRDAGAPHADIAGRIVARLKVMAGMDIAERRLPQDGRLRITLSQTQSLDFRMSTLPTLWGEKVVLRILDPSAASLTVEALGYDHDQQTLFRSALHKKQGMILVTGPTGSGKTVSLYTGLSLLNTMERNISTAEDPVEINLDGINQVAVNRRTGLDFSTALRAFLRQDPDVIMLGEIRDQETAEIAIKAAQTGHLVLSTLHTNSAADAISRLLNMGIAHYNLADALTLIIAQRLARRLCPACKIPTQIDPQSLAKAGMSDQQIASATLFRPAGCPRCTDGYRGRLGIVEVLQISPDIVQLINQKANTADIIRCARRQQYRCLRESAMSKVAQGLTSLAEAERVM